MKLHLIGLYTVLCLVFALTTNAETVENVETVVMDASQQVVDDTEEMIQETMDQSITTADADTVESPPDELVSTDESLPDNLYIIQPGDVLIINVWKETDLQGSATVLPDGTLSFPLVGIIHVANKTLPIVRDEVLQRLSKYLSDPVVTVSMASLTGNQIYVIGNVGRPGAFEASRNLDVMQLLSLAGGMTNFAAVNKVKILRRVNGTETVIEFRYRDVEKGRKLEQNIILQSGDVVVVP